MVHNSKKRRNKPPLKVSKERSKRTKITLDNIRKDDKSLYSRIQYKKNNIAKIRLIKANNSPMKLSSPKNIHFFPIPSHKRAKLKINTDNWRIEQTGKDFVILKGDLLQMFEECYRTKGESFKQVFFN